MICKSVEQIPISGVNMVTQAANIVTQAVNIVTQAANIVTQAVSTAFGTPWQMWRRWKGEKKWEGGGLEGGQREKEEGLRETVEEYKMERLLLIEEPG